MLKPRVEKSFPAYPLFPVPSSLLFFVKTRILCYTISQKICYLHSRHLPRGEWTICQTVVTVINNTRELIGVNHESTRRTIS